MTPRVRITCAACGAPVDVPALLPALPETEAEAKLAIATVALVEIAAQCEGPIEQRALQALSRMGIGPIEHHH